ncbi:unnamed protein product, partial [Effrenium voratum]
MAFAPQLRQGPAAGGHKLPPGTAWLTDVPRPSERSLVEAIRGPRMGWGTMWAKNEGPFVDSSEVLFEVQSLETERNQAARPCSCSTRWRRWWHKRRKSAWQLPSYNA